MAFHALVSDVKYSSSTEHRHVGCSKSHSYNSCDSDDRTHPNFLRVVMGPRAQFYPCEASEKKCKMGTNFWQKLSQKVVRPKSNIQSQELSLQIAAIES